MVGAIKEYLVKAIRHSKTHRWHTLYEEVKPVPIGQGMLARQSQPCYLKSKCHDGCSNYGQNSGIPFPNHSTRDDPEIPTETHDISIEQLAKRS